MRLPHAARLASMAHRNELGEFLKARRAELSPRTVGLPDTGGPRRVAGLRREEVAKLAAVSTRHYTLLEQGRVRASASVLAALARALHLGDDQRDQLLALAGTCTVRPRRRGTQQVQPSLRWLLDDLTATPAMVLGSRLDIVAWNPLAAALLVDFAEIPAKNRNYVRLLFTEPAMRERYPDWANVARGSVAALRAEAARYPDDARLTALVGELAVRDTDFGTWWAARQLPAPTRGTKTLRHPVAGDLVLDWDTLTSDGDQRLVVWTAEPGTPSAEGLRFLASWAAAGPTG